MSQVKNRGKKTQHPKDEMKSPVLHEERWWQSKWLCICPLIIVGSLCVAYLFLRFQGHDLLVDFGLTPKSPDQRKIVLVETEEKQEEKIAALDAQEHKVLPPEEEIVKEDSPEAPMLTDEQREAIEEKLRVAEAARERREKIQKKQEEQMFAEAEKKREEQRREDAKNELITAIAKAKSVWADENKALATRRAAMHRVMKVIAKSNVESQLAVSFLEECIDRSTIYVYSPNRDIATKALQSLSGLGDLGFKSLVGYFSEKHQITVPGLQSQYQKEIKLSSRRQAQDRYREILRLRRLNALYALKEIEKLPAEKLRSIAPEILGVVTKNFRPRPQLYAHPTFVTDLSTKALLLLQKMKPVPDSAIPIMAKIVDTGENFIWADFFWAPMGAREHHKQILIALDIIGNSGAKAKKVVPNLAALLKRRPHEELVFKTFVILHGLGRDARTAIPAIRWYLSSPRLGKQAEKVIESINSAQ